MRGFLTLLLILFAVAPAAAEIGIEMAFDPAEVAPGDMVTFSASLTNSSEETVFADFEFGMTFNEHEVGPVLLQLPLSGGKDVQVEVPLMIPADMTAGDLAISMTVTVDGMSDSATASLTITGDNEGDPNAALAGLAAQIVSGFAAANVPTSMDSVGALKTTW